LKHDDKTVDADHTYILNEYTIPCNGIVVAWEFCYRTSRTASSQTFYPGIWRITDTKKNGETDYKLVQSNAITFTPNGSNNTSCHRVNLLEADHFTVPAGSVVGLYSSNNKEKKSPLLHTNDIDDVITYKNDKKLSEVKKAGKGRNKPVRYNIAIKVHLSKLTFLICTVV